MGQPVSTLHAEVYKVHTIICNVIGTCAVLALFSVQRITLFFLLATNYSNMCRCVL